MELLFTHSLRLPRTAPNSVTQDADRNLYPPPHCFVQDDQLLYTKEAEYFTMGDVDGVTLDDTEMVVVLDGEAVEVTELVAEADLVSVAVRDAVRV